MPGRPLLRGAFLALPLVLLLALLAACSKPAAFNNVDITGAEYARDFALTDAEGARRSLADYRGKVTVVFFGFTQCPDVCPTTLADLAAVKQKLGKDGERLQVVFITLDPERDTPQVLKPYVANFDPSFVALHGSLDDTAKTAKEFKVFYQKVPGRTPTSYTLDHTAGSYVFDAEGKVRLFVRHAQGVDALVADIKRLM